jgi:hypothetical protein
MSSGPRDPRPRAEGLRGRAPRPLAVRLTATAGARGPGLARPARRHLPRRSPVPRSATARRPPPARRRRARQRPPHRRPPRTRRPGRLPRVPVPRRQLRRGPRFPRCLLTAAPRPVPRSLAAARCPAPGPAARVPVVRGRVGPAQDRAVQARAVQARVAQDRARARPGLAPRGPVAAVAPGLARVPVTTPTLPSPPAWARPRVARHPGRVSPGRGAPVRRPPARVVPVRAVRVRRARPGQAARDGPARRTWPVPAVRVPARAACRRGPPAVALVAVPAVRAVAVPAAAAAVPARDAQAAVAVAVPARVPPVPAAVAAVPAHVPE